MHDQFRSPLSDEDVLEIRRLARIEGWSQGRLARQFKRTIGTIGRIVRGETHQHVGMPRAVPASEIAESEARMLELLRSGSLDDQGPVLPDALKLKKPNPYT